MKVYAEYFEKDGLLFRRNTLLHFGDSWNLIGNAVLANPGSANPIGLARDEALAQISSFYNTYRREECFDSRNWHEFSPDSTMDFLEKIFSGWYVGKNIKLNGVIQLFNTFNIKNQNLQEAAKQARSSSELMFSHGVSNHFNGKPTYFGFSSTVLNDEALRKVAIEIFEGSPEVVKRIYNRDFNKNSFYHPIYVNRAHNQPVFQEYKNTVLAAIIENEK